jgi:hypothetical protein
MLITFHVTDALDSQQPVALETAEAIAAIDRFDIRAACLHLIYAAYATALERPWEQAFIISDRQIVT